MIRKINLLNLGGKYRLQGQTLTREELCLLFNMHGYTIERTDSLGFFTSALGILEEIPEEDLTHSLEDLSEMTLDDKVAMTRRLRNKLGLLVKVGNN